MLANRAKKAYNISKQKQEFDSMKKLLALVATIAVAASVLAQEAETTDKVENDDVLWPAFIALCEWPSTPDLVGLRLTIPFSTKQESVTGIDLGLWGRCRDFEGIAINILRNDAKDTLGGLQIGLYNTANRADLGALQIGLWNETQSVRGLQVGLVNVTGDAQGFQVGLINRAETLYGFQAGLINVIRDGECPVMVGVNIGW